MLFYVFKKDGRKNSLPPSVIKRQHGKKGKHIKRGKKMVNVARGGMVVIKKAGLGFVGVTQ